MVYRIETHGETPEEAAAFVEAYMQDTLGVEVRITPLTRAA
jgi:hypothetical protein